MKKIIIFLIITTLLLLISPNITNAKTTSFYEAEFIPNIWMNKKNPTDGLTYYNQARFFRETNTNNIAYCIEPFIFFNGGEKYEGTENPANYTQDQITNMTLISHYGYGYQNHTEPKWYAITQFLLWKTAEPTGYYYFSSYKNGPEVNMFQEEINELTTLVNNHKKNTSFNQKQYYIVEDEQLIITDTNNVLNSFKTTSNIATIKNNTLTTTKLKAGTYTINLEKNSKIYNRPILFYQSATNQDIIDTGDPTTINNKITINVLQTNVKIKKIDEETLKTEPQGEASLAGAIFDLYTTYGEYIRSITIDEENSANITNLPFGTYYLKEKTPGTGYKTNETKYYFTLSKDQTNIKFSIRNQVIKATIKITKEYGYKEHFQPEENISFNIYNKNNKLIKTITTNKDGYVEITLPYGEYKLIQLTSTEGYQKVEPIYFKVTSEDTITYNLKDYKIEVPNTKNTSIITKIITFLKEIICGKR